MLLPLISEARASMEWEDAMTVDAWNFREHLDYFAQMGSRIEENRHFRAINSELVAVEVEIAPNVRLAMGLRSEHFEKPGFTEAKMRECLLDCRLDNPKSSVWTDRSPTGNVTDDILCSLLGSARGRPREWRFSPSNEASTRSIIEESVRRDQPIDALCMFSLRKNFCCDRIEVTADMGEFLALRKLISVHNDIKRVYPPGLKITVVFEDIAGELLQNHSFHRVRDMYYYGSQIEGMAEILAPGLFRLVRESEFYLGRPVPKEFSALAGDKFSDFSELCAVARYCADLIFKYLNESKEKGVIPRSENDENSGYHLLASYKAIKDLGWCGSIPQNQRDHFFKRATREFGWEPDSSLFYSNLALYLGAVLARQKLGLLRQELTAREEKHIKPLKLSFISHPPGTPSILEEGRIEYVCHDREKRSNTKYVPWGGSGGFEFHGGGVSVKFLRQRLSARVPGSYAPMELSSNGKSVNFYAKEWNRAAVDLIRELPDSGKK